MEGSTKRRPARTPASARSRAAEKVLACLLVLATGALPACNDAPAVPAAEPDTNDVLTPDGAPPDSAPIATEDLLPDPEDLAPTDLSDASHGDRGTGEVPSDAPDFERVGDPDLAWPDLAWPDLAWPDSAWPDTDDPTAADATDTDATSTPDADDLAAADAPWPDLDAVPAFDAEPYEGPRFVDISARIGDIDLAGAPLGVGVCIVDVDGDGLLDLVWSALLRNLGDNTFEDRSEDAGLRGRGYGQCATHADVDNDGDSDLYMRSVARGALLLNDGAGHFTDVWYDWGMDQPAIRSAGAFGDFDNDGWIDLYELVNRPPETGGANYLWWNQRPGYRLVTRSPGGHDEVRGRTLAGTFTHLDDDGLIDLYVVNDWGMLYDQNRIYRNLGPDPDDPLGWRWEEVSAELGMDVRVAGMGTTFGDIDNDGDLEYYIANVANNVLFVMGDDGVARDRARAWGVEAGHYAEGSPRDPEVPPWPTYEPDSTSASRRGFARFCADYCEPGPESWPTTSWGGHFFDADQDGWLDLWVAAGFVAYPDALAPEPRDQPNWFFRNRGGERFVRVRDERVFPEHRGVHRGGAVGDLDGDGDLDLAFIDIGRGEDGSLVLYENQYATGNWLQVELVSTHSNPDAIGARVTVEAGGLRMLREVDGAMGFSSRGQRDPHFGLGDADTVTRLTVRWPRGAVSELTDLAANQRVRVVEPAPSD